MSAPGFADVVSFSPGILTQFGEYVDEEWILEAIIASVEERRLKEGKEHLLIRNRKLPLENVLWLIIGMGLFRDRSIHEVVTHLGLVVERPGSKEGLSGPAIGQAREKAGIAGIKTLFNQSAAHWSSIEGGEPWCGLTAIGIDAFCLRVPDTRENDEAFGRPGGKGSPAGYPQVRCLALSTLRTHVMRAIAIGGYKQSEMEIALELIDQVPPNSMTVHDRGFVCWGFLHRMQSRGENRHWCVRGKEKLALKVIKNLGPGDDLVEISPAADARRKYPDLPKSLVARRVQCTPAGYRSFFVLTSVLDPQQFPATALAALYRERWELETEYDEIKTHLLERLETTRSTTPDGVRQELYGIAMGYNLVRLEMARVARQAGVSPLRISFRHSVHMIRAFCIAIWATSQGAIPRRLASLESDLRLLILPERRTERRYPREVKVMTTSYSRKKPQRADKPASPA